MKIIYTLFFTVLLGLHVSAQSGKGPVRYTGPVPADFTEKYSNRELSIPEGRSSKDLSKSELKRFELEIRYSVDALMKSGLVFFNDEMSAYLNKVAATMLKDEPGLSGEVKIYATRLPIVNARSLGEGTLLIDAGLIARAENEAQLAFVLGHELSHYLKDHSFDSYRHNSKVKEDIANNRADEEELLIKKMRHSQKAEFQADKEGFQRMARRYKPQEALNMLRILDQADRDHFPDSLNFMAFFNTTEVPLDSMYTKISRKKKKDYEAESARKKEKKKTSKSGKQEKTNEKKGETDDEEVDLVTHPDVSKRIAALEKVRKELGDTGSSEFIISRELFEAVKREARQENALELIENGKLGQGLFQALQLLHNDPKDQFAAELAGKAMYWLCFYQSRESFSKVMTKKKVVKQASYDRLYDLMLKIHMEDKLIQVASVFLKNYAGKFPESGELLIHFARVSELDKKAKSTSKELYKQYVQKFPKGQHAVFAAKRMKAA